jgi:hypothetical protein
LSSGLDAMMGVVCYVSERVGKSVMQKPKMLKVGDLHAGSGRSFAGVGVSGTASRHVMKSSRAGRRVNGKRAIGHSACEHRFAIVTSTTLDSAHSGGKYTSFVVEKKHMSVSFFLF